MNIDSSILIQGLSSIIALIVGLSIVRYAPIALKSFVAVYLLLSAGNLAYLYYTSTMENLIGATVATGVGFLALVIAAGFGGTLIPASDYQTILVAVGLFPWYLDLNVSLFYMLFIAILVSIWIGLSTYSNFKKINSPISFKKLKTRMKKDDYEAFKKGIVPILTTPIGVAAIIAVASMSVI